MKSLVIILSVFIGILFIHPSAFAEQRRFSSAISAARAQELAGLYMYRFISPCGAADIPILRDGYWEVPIVTGQAAQPAGSIRVDSRSGSMSYPGQPTITPKELEQASTSGTVAQEESPAATPRDKSVAVLPFESLSEDLTNADLASGLQQEVINRLIKVHDLKVASQADVMQYEGSPSDPPEVGRQLGVAHVVKGRVRSSGDRVRVSVQLIEAETDMHLWAEDFDRQITDLPSIGSEIAEAVAEAIGAKLSDAERAAIERPPGSP